MKPMIIYLYLGIFGCFTLSGMAWIFSKVHHQPQLGVVDMQVLIAKHSQHLAKPKAGQKSGKVSSYQIQELSDRLKEDLEFFAAKHNLILLAKGSVMGGKLPDYTDEFLPLSDRFLNDSILSLFDLSKSLSREKFLEDRP
jgi:hypothetical protein